MWKFMGVEFPTLCVDHDGDPDRARLPDGLDRHLPADQADLCADHQGAGLRPDLFRRAVLH